MGVLLVAIAAAVVIVVAGGGSSSPKVAVLPPTMHRTGPETIFTPGAALKTNPSATLQGLEKMGVTRVRVFFTWNQIAPDPTATKEPAGFDASNPAAYPAANWAQYDTIIKGVESHHLGLDVVLGPPPPRWAEGKGAPDPVVHTYWKPNAREFQDFVQAVGTRYSGHYTPAGASKPLPRVAFWSIWNEPNIGVSLAPQAVDHGTVEESSRLYRQLADAAWNGLQSLRPRQGCDAARRNRPGGRHLRPRQFQRDGAPAVPARAVLRGRQLQAADRLGRHRPGLPGDRGRLSALRG